MTPASKRRWTFTLRTLFVVMTVACCGLGWVVDRLAWIKHRHDDEHAIWAYLRWPDWHSSAPGMLWLFGEHEAFSITYSFGGTADEVAPKLAQLQRLFPEASVSVDVFPPQSPD